MNQKTASRLLAGIGIAFYSVWIISAYLNPKLSIAHSYVSELSVSGQPYAWFFRVTQLLGSLCLLAYCWLQVKKTRLKRIHIVLAVCTASAAVNAFFPMICSPYLSRSCLASLDSYNFGFNQYVHQVTSLITFGGLILAQLLAFKMPATGLRRKWHLSHFILQVVVSAAIAYISFHGNHFIGLLQRISLAAFEIWVISLAFMAYEHKSAPSDHQTGVARVNS